MAVSVTAERDFGVSPGWVRRLVECGLKQLKARAVSVSVALVTPATAVRLNRIYRGQTAPANVLAFRYGEAGVLGELVLCVPQARVEARRFQLPWREHLARLTIHGLLHLHGQHHHRPLAARRLERLERRLLGACR